MVELEDIGYRVGDAEILRGVSVPFRRGRFNVVLGPNGAGKSTLLRLAAGLIAPTSGRVRYAEKPLDSYGPLELARSRALLSQHVEMPFPLPSEDVVMMGRYPHYERVPTARDHDVVEQALALVEIAHKRRQAYPTLSGGEQQKIQLARVLAQIWDDASPLPRVLFLDEPTSSLDVHHQIHLLEITRRWVAAGCTVVATLHDLNVALHYGDSFFVMDGGRLAFACDDAGEITADLLAGVFRVPARQIADPVTGESFWRFGS